MQRNNKQPQKKQNNGHKTTTERQNDHKRGEKK